MRVARQPLLRTGRYRLALVLLAALASGCATYSDLTAQAMVAASAGQYERGIASINSTIGVKTPEGLPEHWDGNRALSVLERSVFQQALQQYRESAIGLSAAEQELEMLDLKSDPVGSIGRYLYSDSALTYKTPPTERLSVNALNLLNYLAQAELDGAAIEARRFQVMRDYLDSIDVSAEGPATLGTYLAGFVFEKLGEGDRALRYYDEALASGPLASLNAPIAQLARNNPYRGDHIDAVLAQSPPATDRSQDGEILVVINAGRVPHRIPERIPVGAAIGIAGSILTDDIDPLRYGAGKVVVYPALVDTPSTLGSPRILIDGQDVRPEVLVDLGRAIAKEYEEAKPRIIAAALTRMAARAAAAEGVRQAGRKESNVLGDVLSIATEVALVALDKPDTRSWQTLPKRVLVARVPVAAGEHAVEVTFAGSANAGRRESVDVPRDGFAAVVVTEPR